MDEYLKHHHHKKFKEKKYCIKTSNQSINNSSLKNNILQFSFNAINTILINNLNSSISPGILNLTNNIPKNNTNKIMNSNAYINSINDCIDYKLKGNIYKISHNEFLNMKYLHYLQHQHCSYKHGECHHQRLNAQRKLLEYAKL